MAYPFLSVKVIATAALAVLSPPPDLTVSQWADKYRRLSAESSAMPGIYRTSVTEYMREPMDMVGTPGVRRITCMFSAQVAKSTFLENVIGYLMHYDACPILHVSPTLASMKMFSKERLSPMLRDTPVLKGLVKDARSRDSDNTIDTKKFPGGNLAMVGANAPAGLASRPVRAVFFDEVDRFERSAGSEGDPIALAIKRATTYWNRIIIMVSTPGNKGASRIEEEFEKGDQRYYYVPCPDCGHYQRLRWEHVHFDKEDPDGAVYVCAAPECGSIWDDATRNKIVHKGHWRATKPYNGNISYHLNQLYSPFAPLADGVREFLEAKGNPELLKTWVNTFLGETWEDAGERIDYTDVMDKQEEYESQIPYDVTLLTCGVDIQDTWFEAEIVGWGDDNKSWSIDHKKFYGDPSTPAPWAELRAYLKQIYVHPEFGEIPIRSTCVDTGGHFTTEVYKFTAAMTRVYAIKGVGGEGRPMVGKPSRANVLKIPLYPLGVHTIKETVAARLRIDNPDLAGNCVFPKGEGYDDSYNDDYFKGLVSEKLITKFKNGRKVKEFLPFRKRNEPWDCRVYATAALEIMGVDLNAQRRALMNEVMRAKPIEETVVEEKPYTPSKTRRKKKWVDGWKND